MGRVATVNRVIREGFLIGCHVSRTPKKVRAKSDGCLENKHLRHEEGACVGAEVVLLARSDRWKEGR